MLTRSLHQSENQASLLLGSEDPTKNFKHFVGKKTREGVELNDKEKEYLLPHFTMLMVGKPGSGKTTMIQHLLYNEDMYKRKFDKVLLISPSASKTGLRLPKDCINLEFDIEWIFAQLGKVMEKQNNVLATVAKEFTVRETHKDEEVGK